jgi:hypothetical protein
MDNVAHQIKCPHCLTSLRLVVSEFGGKVEVDPIAGASNKDKLELVEHYKAVKEYVGTRGDAFDKTHRARAFHHAKKILAQVPILATAKLAIEWTRDEYRRRGCGTDGTNWNLGTVEKWVPDFLVWEAKQRAQKKVASCAGCLTRARVEGALVCADCAWCWQCDEKGKPSRKAPRDMVPQPLTQPICKDCAAALTK